jgi:hypothetical protein
VNAWRLLRFLGEKKDYDNLMLCCLFHWICISAYTRVVIRCLLASRHGTPPLHKGELFEADRQHYVDAPSVFTRYSLTPSAPQQQPLQRPCRHIASRP